MFGATALFVVLAQAANVNVYNNCNFYVKATPSEGGADDRPLYIEPGDKYTGTTDGSAMCLKLYASQSGGGWAENPTQLEWTTWQTSGKTVLSYDLSNIDMKDDTSFLQHGMNLTSADPSCDSEDSTCRPAICTAQGADLSQPCQDAYNQPYDTRTLGASANYDLAMHLCTKNDQSESSDAPSSFAPAPTSSDDGAVPLQADATGGPVSEGAAVTEYTTITARNAQPTADAGLSLEKRIAHMHHARHQAHM